MNRYALILLGVLAGCGGEKVFGSICDATTAPGACDQTCNPSPGQGNCPGGFFCDTDGRCDAPLLEGKTFQTGTYELIFSAGAYFRTLGIALPDPMFLDEVPIRFGMAEAAHYHVPLLISPGSSSHWP